MAITVNTLSYAHDGNVNPNLALYRGPAATIGTKDLIALGRTLPNPSGDFAGVARSRIKRTKTVTLADSSTHEVTVEVLIGVPVGASVSDVNGLLDDVGDLLTSAVGQNLANEHEITV